MPITASAKKALRQSIKRKKRNTAQKTRIKKQEKLVASLIKQGKTNEAKTELQKYYKLVDRAGKNNIIHKNKAARKKSRLTKLMNKTNKK